MKIWNDENIFAIKCWFDDSCNAFARLLLANIWSKLDQNIVIWSWFILKMPTTQRRRRWLQTREWQWLDCDEYFDSLWFDRKVCQYDIFDICHWILLKAIWFSIWKWCFDLDAESSNDDSLESHCEIDKTLLREISTFDRDYSLIDM